MKPADFLCAPALVVACGRCKVRRARSGLVGDGMKQLCHVCFALEHPDLVTGDLDDMIRESFEAASVESYDEAFEPLEPVNCRCVSVPVVEDDAPVGIVFDLTIGIQCDCGETFSRRIRLGLAGRKEVRCGKCRARFAVSSRIVEGDAVSLLFERIPRKA